MEYKKILIGGLAIVGAIALFNYLKPKVKSGSQEYLNARGNFASCVNKSGNYYGTGGSGNCKKGDRGVSRYA
jgi:hypothetical protein